MKTQCPRGTYLLVGGCGFGPIALRYWLPKVTTAFQFSIYHLKALLTSWRALVIIINIDNPDSPASYCTCNIQSTDPRCVHSLQYVGKVWLKHVSRDGTVHTL